MFQRDMLRESLFKYWCYLLASVVLLTGVFYFKIGFDTTNHGQFWYLLLIGILLCLSAFNICRKKSKGVWLYLLLFILCLLWTYQHTAPHLWLCQLQLIWLTMLCAALLLTLPAIRKYQYQVPRFRGLAYGGAALLILLLLLALYLNYSQ